MKNSKPMIRIISNIRTIILANRRGSFKVFSNTAIPGSIMIAMRTAAKIGTRSEREIEIRK